MVCNLTIGKKKYADVEDDMKEPLAKTETLRLELAQLIEEDAAAFDKVMAAHEAPEGDRRGEGVAEGRACSRRSSTRRPCRSPSWRSASRSSRWRRPVAANGNTNAVSDAGVAALVGRAGAHAAGLNVLINLGGISAPEHQAFVEKARAAIADLGSAADAGCDEVMATVLPKVS